jgi:hypothetical protein
MATPPDFSPGQVLTAAHMDAVGLWLVKSQTIGSAVSSVTVTDAFSADWDNYKIIVFGGSATTGGDLRIQLGSSTTSYYGGVFYHPYGTAGPANVQGVGINNGSYITCGSIGSNGVSTIMDVMRPFVAATTGFSIPFVNLNSNGSATYASGIHNVATSYTAFTLLAAAGTMTGGTIRVYGYRN